MVDRIKNKNNLNINDLKKGPGRAEDPVNVQKLIDGYFKGATRRNADDTMRYPKLSEMNRVQKKYEAVNLMRQLNYETTNGLSYEKQFEVIADESIDDFISELRSAADRTNDLQDGVIGSFSQGKTGDCGFLSTLKALSSNKKYAKKIEKLITDNKNGTYTVVFPDAKDKPYTFSNEEIEAANQYSTGDKDVRILEMAAEKHRVATQGVGLRAIFPTEARQLLIGEKYKFFAYGKNAALSVDKDKMLYLDTSEVLKMIPDGKFFVVSDLKYSQNGEKEIGHAFYAKKEGKMLKLFNPHNTMNEAVSTSCDDLVNSGKYMINY